MRVYLNDLQHHEVRFAKGQDGQVTVEGLPILKVGKWNEVEYTGERLADMVSSFAAIKQREGWVPP